MNQNTKRPDLVCLADVEAKPAPWLWPGYLAYGMLALLSGDPGAGKTFLSLAIAADLSRGRLPASDNMCEPINTLYMSNENAPEFVVRPRFDAQGGDASRLHMLLGSLTGEGNAAKKEAFTFKDLEVLQNALQTTKARLVIIDPLQSYVGAGVNCNLANETRPLLDGLAKTAEKNDACILLLRHLNKGSEGKAMYRGLGSIDFTGAARMEMLAGCDSQDKNSRALLQIKNNVAGYAKGLGYRIHSDGSSVAHLEWTGASALTDADLLGPPFEAASRPKIDCAVEFLQRELSTGPKLQNTLSESSGIHNRTLERAFEKIGGIKSRAGERGAWLWGLAPPSPTSESIPVNACT